MSKWSIRAKIIAVIVFMLITMSGLGLLAIRSMQLIGGHTMEIANNWLPSVRILGELRADNNLYRITLRAHQMALTAEEKAAVDKRMASVLESIASRQKTYETMISAAEERAIYQNWMQAWSRYLADNAAIIAISRENIGRLPDQSAPVFKSVSVAAAEADKWLAKAIDYNNVGADAATKAAAASFDKSFWIVLAIIGGAIAAGTIVGWYLVHDVSRGIADIVKPMQALGAGDLSTEILHRGENTEIGTMADTLQVFKEALIAKMEADTAAAREADAKLVRGRRIEQATREFETAISNIVDTVSSASMQLETSAGTLSSNATRSQELSTVVAAASEEASTNVQSVASATEELSSSITEISRQVQESARMAAEAVGQARRTNERVSALSQAAARIGDVVELINSIAGQTNLLALNATIEAARAGEAGRGFAVVASEVKALAEQTAKATEEIGQQVSGIQGATSESATAIKDISGTIERLSEIASAIAAAVEQQGAATQEISRNVQQAAVGTQQVSENITDVKRGASQTDEASSDVLNAAQNLSRDSDRLKSEVSKFLTSVRAA